MVVLACGSQMGKSEGLLDVIGWRMDQRPVPIMYVGPDRNFVETELEPRLMDMIDSASALSRKVARGKRLRKSRKVIGGVQLRLAWAGSASQLAGMSAGLVMVDEYDRMLANVKGEGDPLEMMKARGFAFKDRQRGVTSTPLLGFVEVYKCEASGLEFWKVMAPDDISSAVWKLWQSGTMYHFAWPCPCCGKYFIPRFKQLRGWEGKTKSQAKRDAYLECPHGCGGVIDEVNKKDLNARGRYVAPGQTITPDGVVHGHPPENSTASYWVSGLCSPFVTIGERAEAYVEALNSGDQNKLQGVINTGMGEIFAPGGGEAPELEEIKRARQEHYKLGDIPAGTVHLTCGVDVQKDRLYYAIRAWGARSTSWLVHRGELLGETHEPEVWESLQDVLDTPIHGHAIKIMMVDSGFRPGKPHQVPENRVYEFARANTRQVRASKGRATATIPVRRRQIEVDIKGTTKKYGLELVIIDTDYTKSFVHERLRRKGDAGQLGAWMLPRDIDETYLEAILSESRVRRPNGQPTWIARTRNNHYLDCEALNVAAGHLLNVHAIREGRGTKEIKAVETDDVASADPAVAVTLAAAPIAAPQPIIAPTPALPATPKRPPPRPSTPAKRRSLADYAAALNGR